MPGYSIVSNDTGEVVRTLKHLAPQPHNSWNYKPRRSGIPVASRKRKRQAGAGVLNLKQVALVAVFWAVIFGTALYSILNGPY